MSVEYIPDGYEILPPGSKIKRGDMYWGLHTKTWELIEDDCIGDIHDYDTIVCRRRKHKSISRQELKELISQVRTIL
jgi:hypothetical protein